MPRNTSEKANMQIYRLTLGQLSPLDVQQNVRGYPGIVNDIQPCPKRCLLMPLVCVGVRTDSTTRAATTRGVANFRARVLAYVQYVPRVCTLVLLLFLSLCQHETIICREILGPSTRHVYKHTHCIHTCARLVRGPLTDRHTHTHSYISCGRGHNSINIVPPPPCHKFHIIAQ